MTILYSMSDICMSKNGKDTKHTRHIAIILQLLINLEKCKMHQIDWCKGGLRLEDIATNNVGEN